MKWKGQYARPLAAVSSRHAWIRLDGAGQRSTVVTAAFVLQCYGAAGNSASATATLNGSHQTSTHV